MDMVHVTTPYPTTGSATVTHTTRQQTAASCVQTIVADTARAAKDAQERVPAAATHTTLPLPAVAARMATIIGPMDALEYALVEN